MYNKYIVCDKKNGKKLEITQLQAKGMFWTSVFKISNSSETMIAKNRRSNSIQIS